MFKVFFTYIVFFIRFTISAETDCTFIKPKKPSDCKLSEKDIKDNYKYCCFQNYTYFISCDPYTEEGFKTFFDVKDAKKCSTQTKLAEDKESSYSGCESVTPKSKSDCVLTEEDKQNGAEYCCFFKDGNDLECTAETKESYQAAKVLFDAFKSEGDILDCGTSKAGYINLSVLSFILIILNL